MTPYSTNTSQQTTAVPLPKYCQTTDRLQALIESVNTDTIAFQSVLVSAIQILDRVYLEEQRIAHVAISLAQRRKMADMVTRIKLLRFSLRAILNDQGMRILQLQSKPQNREDMQISWWYHLTEGIETLESGIDWIGSIISGQPHDSPARKLSDLIAGLLRSHYDELLKEAEHWLMV